MKKIKCFLRPSLLGLFGLADAITDHGAENVDTAQRTSTETFPRPLVSDLFFPMFLDCISIACEKKLGHEKNVEFV